MTSETKFRVWSNHSKTFTTNIIRCVPLILCRWITLLESPWPRLMIVYKCLPSVNSLFSVQFNSVRLNYYQKGQFHQTCSQTQTNKQQQERQRNLKNKKREKSHTWHSMIFKTQFLPSEGIKVKRLIITSIIHCVSLILFTCIYVFIGPLE